MAGHRIDRLNSLIKEVISDVIRDDVKNPHLPSLITVTRVDVTKDLHYAKVYVSIIGDQAKKAKAIEVLQSAAGFIATHASKQIVIRYFPQLTFYIDDGLDKQMRIEELLSNIRTERDSRETDVE